MATSVIKWEQGEGNIVATYEGSGNGPIAITLEPNTGDARQQEITIKTTDESKIVTILVKQAGGVVQHTYTRLTYIESTRAQHIKLGYQLKETDTIDVLYQSINIESVDQFLFGAPNTWFSTYNNSGYVRFGHSSSTTLTNGAWRWKMQLSKGKLIQNGITTTTLGYTSVADGYLCLFSGNSSAGVAYNRGAFRVLYFRINSAEGEIMNLAPAKRDSDGKVGMLDLVSGKFFVNADDGEDFIGGNEVRISEDYELIDKVNFNNDKAYDTEVYGNEQTYIDVLFQRTDTSGADYLFGCSSGNRLTGYLTTSGYWRYGSAYPTFNTANKNVFWAQVTPTKTSLNETNRSFSTSAFTTAFTLPLGGHKPSSGVITKTYQGDVYYFRIKQGNELVVDWYPCVRKSDGIQGFWDCLAQKFIEPV